MTQTSSRKVTLSLPEDLVAFADARAAARGTNRSRVIGELLAAVRRRERDDLAAEGYRFYAGEAREFADASAAAVAEAIADDRSTW